MIIIARLIFIAVLFLNNRNYDPKDKSIFISPLRIPLSLSSNFGELRKDHFHSGIDIKTQGVTGKEVIATGNGYIYRITVSPAGFGKALYVKHSSGYSTVYGHLERFTTEIEQYVKERQYENKSFLITLYPAKDDFPVKQGDIIAYSGNSGSSGGPHLHYEIRKSDSEIPINPLLFDFGAADNTRPVIEKLAIYPEGAHTTINQSNSIKRFNVAGSNGKYFISAENEITINGPAGFGIKSFDMMKDSYNKFTVYSIELSIDSNIVFKYVMDGFSFDETRYVNSHIDYEAYQKEDVFYEKMFVLPNDKLSVYRDVVNRGIYNFNDNRSHSVKISVADIYNNKSTLAFNVRCQHVKLPKQDKPPEATSENDEIMPFGMNNKFTGPNISVTIPEGALYDTLYFNYKCIKGSAQMLSDLHCVHNRYTPLHKPYNLSIKPTKIPRDKEAKMLIVMVANDQRKFPVKSTWSDGYITAGLLDFGNFYIGIDTIAPDISIIELPKGSDFTGRTEMKFRISDDFSGIKTYEPIIDGKWALFEYDQKNMLLTYRFDEKRITSGSKHSLVLKVSDNRDNISFYKGDFIW